MIEYLKGLNMHKDLNDLLTSTNIIRLKMSAINLQSRKTDADDYVFVVLIQVGAVSQGNELGKAGVSFIQALVDTPDVNSELKTFLF